MANKGDNVLPFTLKLENIYFMSTMCQKVSSWRTQKFIPALSSSSWRNQPKEKEPKQISKIVCGECSNKYVNNIH